MVIRYIISNTTLHWSRNRDYYAGLTYKITVEKYYVFFRGLKGYLLPMLSWYPAEVNITEIPSDRKNCIILNGNNGMFKSPTLHYESLYTTLKQDSHLKCYIIVVMWEFIIIGVTDR